MFFYVTFASFVVKRSAFYLSAWILLAALLVGCEREQRRFSEIAPASGRSQPTRLTDLQPGTPGTTAPETTPTWGVVTGKGPYDENGWAVSEGKRLYTWYNCAGCHANGGGGMGPPLIDDKWIYGSEPENIYATIVQGRPNGMPAFGGKIPEQQVWQLVAYVRSMSGLLRKDVRPGRNDDMAARPSEQSMKPQTPKPSGSNSPSSEKRQ